MNSPLWTAIVSDITGRPQLIPRETIGACYGDALLAAIGTGIAGPKTDWTVIDHVVEPDQSRQACYDEIYPLWRELYPATRGPECIASAPWGNSELSVPLGRPAALTSGRLRPARGCPRQCGGQ